MKLNGRPLGADKLKDLLAWQDKQLEAHGWFSHIVGDDLVSPTGFNYHTHGLPEKLGHPDLQIVCTLDGKVAHRVATALVDRIKAGERLACGQVVEGALKGGYRLTLAWAREGGRDVLRVILPDPENRVARGEIAAAFAKQYEGCLPEGEAPESTPRSPLDFKWEDKP